VLVAHYKDAQQDTLVGLMHVSCACITPTNVSCYAPLCCVKIIFLSYLVGGSLVNETLQKHSSELGEGGTSKNVEVVGEAQR
jgi:hypothetical protein